MEEKYLPVGTVVLLKEAKKAVVIVGFGIQSKEKPGVIFDYMGALYPEGLISLEKNMVFNHSEIDKILHNGYETDEQKKFNEVLKNSIEKISNSMNDTEIL